MFGTTLFPVAVHAMTSVAALTADDDLALAKASTVARSIDTHVVLVRRLLAQLSKAGLIVATRGKEGGYRLGRNPKQILLSEILEALGEEVIFPMHPKRGNPACPVSRNIKKVLAPIVASAQAELLKDLSRRRLSDLVVEIKKRESET